MRRTKKLFLISIGCAGVIIVLLLTAALIPQLLANRDLVKSYIVAKTGQMTGGKLDYERIEIGYFPIPHLVARDIQLNKPDVFTLRAAELSVYPRILEMLSGRLSIRRLTLDTPDIRIFMPQPAEEEQPVAKDADAGQASLQACIENRMKGIFGALAAIDPETQVEIDQGSATLVFPDGPNIQINTIRAIVANTHRELSLDLKCSSSLLGELDLHATVDITGLQAEGNLSLTDLNPRPILSHLSLPGGITVSDARASGNLDFTIHEANRAKCRFLLQAPTLAVKRGKRVIELAGATLSGKIGYENRELTLSLDTIATQQPALNLSASAILGQDQHTGTTHLQLSATAKQLDVAVAGDVTRAIAGDKESIRTAFNVARAGRLVSPAYAAAFEHDQAGWHLTKMKATGRLSRGLVTIPGIDADIENIAGDVVYEDQHVAFHNLGGLFKGAAFKGLDAAIDWAKQATLSITASSVDVDAAPLFTWLTGFEALAGAKQYVSAINGRAAVSKLTIRGPLAQPGKWDLDITGSPQDLRLKTPRAPFEIKLSGGEIDYRPGNERSSNVGIEFLDASFVASHQSSGIVDTQSASLRIDGSMGPEALAWLTTMIPIPDHLQIKPPVVFSGVNLVWNRATAISLMGELKTAGGVALYVDFTHSPEILQIRKIQFSDGPSKATIAASKRKNRIELTFSGNIEKPTADRLLKSNQILSGNIEGDLQARIDTDVPMNSSFSGRLSGSGLHLHNLARIPIEVRTFSMIGHGNRFDISPSEVALGNTLLQVDGMLDHQDKELIFDINVDADRLDEELIQSLQPEEKEKNPTDNKETPPPIVPKGSIHLRTSALTYGGFTWSPVKADIRIDSDNTRIMVAQAQLCGISTTGELDITPQGIGININPKADNASLQETSNCLWKKPISTDARYDLTGNIHQAPTRGNPSQSLAGQMKFSSENGRIRYASTLMKIFSVLNITEVFTGGKSDLAENGYGYTKASATATIGNGKLHLNEILLDGNALKITGQGSIDLKDDTADIILLAAPLKTVDRIVNKIPIINYITGGSLISFPLRLHGKLSDLSVVPLPPSAVGKGLLNIMERTLKAPFKVVENVGDFVSDHANGNHTTTDETNPQKH